MIDRFAPLRLLVVIVLLLTPVWRWFSTARLSWLYLVVLACALAFFTTPLVRGFARWWGVLDLPGERKVHATPTPLLGGAAVYGAFAVTVLANFDFSRGLKGVAVGGTIVVATGLLDDLTDLPAWLKLCGQTAAASAAIAYGVILNTVPSWVPGVLWLNVILTVLWFLTVTNALQFLDGMDGLAAMGVWANQNPVVSLLTPLLIVGVPLFDIAFVGIVRIVTGKVHSLRGWLAYTGRDHMHHRFAELGLTKTQSVLLIFFIASTLGLSAILLKDATPHEAVLVLLQAACILALVAVLEGVGRGHSRG